MIVSENEVYQIVKKSCVSEKIYEDWADDIGKLLPFYRRIIWMVVKSLKI